MSALAVMAVLGLTLMLPVFMNDDNDAPETDPAEPTDPVEPVDPEGPLNPVDPIEPLPTEPDVVTEQNGTITGTQGNDTLIASEQSPNVNGGAGNDELYSFIDGVEAQLDGGDGDDTLATNALVGFPDLTDGTQTLNGGAGTDRFVINLDVTRFSTDDVGRPLVTITDFERGGERLSFNISTFSEQFRFEGVTQDIAPDDSFTDFNFRFTDTDSILDDLIATVRLEDVAGLNESEFSVDDGRVLVEGTDGDDTIRTTDVNLGRTGFDTLSGGAGDDVLVQEPTDDAGPVILDGGSGNDTLLASEVEFSNPTTLDGGTGDDLLITELFQATGATTVDTFITGEGADTVAISSVFPNLSGSTDFGFVARVADFTPGEDFILIDTSPIQGNSGATFTQDVTLTEDTTNNWTNLRYSVNNIEDGSALSGLIRLEGLTGLTEDDIALTISTLARGLTEGGVVAGTDGDDTIGGAGG